MQQYLDLLYRVMKDGRRKPNRTGTDTIGIIGAFMEFDLRDGFPAVTTKKLYYRKAFAEMLGFLRGYSSAAQFRALGCDVWDKDANENKDWLANQNRKGTDDIGRVYGVQARNWQNNQPLYGDENDEGTRPNVGVARLEIDQLRKVYLDLLNGRDNRREIVSHWNPGEMHLMALPPCHVLYQFGLQPLTLPERMKLSGQVFDAAAQMLTVEEDMQILDNLGVPKYRLDLSLYQRSADLPLGVPFNIAGYAWLLSVMAQITGHQPGILHHYMHDAHIYVDQLDGVREQCKRTTLGLPRLEINPDIDSLEYLETQASTEDFTLVGYDHHPPIRYHMSTS